MITPPSQSSAVPPAPRDPQSSRPAVPAPLRDQVSFARHDQLQMALGRTPEIRPEVVARGRELAVDRNYPPLAIIQDISSIITRSIDPSINED